MRSVPLLFAIAAVVWLTPDVRCGAQDQAFGLGPRLSMVRGDVQADTSAERFTGGQLRAKVSKRTAVELSLDRRSQLNDALTERVLDFPLQASLLLYPVRSTLSPYVLGGIGWYSHRVETLSDRAVINSETNRRLGYHAGFGGEMRVGRHAGLHADTGTRSFDSGRPRRSRPTRLPALSSSPRTGRYPAGRGSSRPTRDRCGPRA